MFDAGEQRDPAGKWAKGGSAAARPAAAKPAARKTAAPKRAARAAAAKPRAATRAAGGGKSLSRIAAKAGISEQRLLQLNPNLRGLSGTGAHVPAGTVIATTAAGRKPAAQSQRGGAVGKSIRHITAAHAGPRTAAGRKRK
jgi:hypothetical protein